MLFALMRLMLKKKYYSELRGKLGNTGEKINNITTGLTISFTAIFVFFVIGEIILRIYYLFDERSNFYHCIINDSLCAVPSITGKTVQTGDAGILDLGKVHNLEDLVQISSYDYVMYELRPNVKAEIYNDRLGDYWSFQTNSRGLRDKEYSFEKPENTFRIIGVGDSFMFGYGSNQGEDYLTVLEKMLNNGSNKNFEVINFAVFGYNAAQEAEVLEKKALPYGPDLIIIHAIGNDMDLPNFIRYARNILTFKKSYFLEFLLNKIGLLKIKPYYNTSGTSKIGLEQVPTSQDGRVNHEYDNTPEEYHFMLGVEGFIRAYKKISRTAENIPVIVVFHNWDAPNESLLYGIIDQAGFYGLELKSENDNFECLSKEYQLSNSDVHLNMEGHECVAEKLYNFIIESKIIH